MPGMTRMHRIGALVMRRLRQPESEEQALPGLRHGIGPVKMEGLIDLIANIAFKGTYKQARHTLGRVCVGAE
jgi:hypothetical protein